jgi:hypothetical protein
VYLFCVTEQDIEREREIGEEEKSPAPWLDEPEPVAIGEGDGMSVEGESGGGLPVSTARTLDREGCIGGENGSDEPRTVCRRLPPLYIRR